VSEIRVGISGWRYPPWRGTFYPPGWPQARELEYAARHVNSVELNGSFYSLQRPESYQAWHDAVPADFRFAVKGGRFITHMKRLAKVDAPLANFFASGVLRLGEKLGPILWQLPPSMAFDEARLDAFFSLLPRDTPAAAALARRHDRRVTGRAWMRPGPRRAVRHAVEVRHESFRDPGFVALLRRHRIALVVADTAGRWPLMEDVTADFVYVRLHGESELYVSGYPDASLAVWAAKVRAWASGRDVFVYFDNDAKVHAPFDATALAARLGLGPRLPFPRGRRRASRGGGAGGEARPRWPVVVERRSGSVVTRPRRRRGTIRSGGRAR
jgi:uncharacterized protein YecE (DUF72 family)